MNLIALFPLLLAFQSVKADWLENIKDGVLEAEAKMKRIERTMSSLGRQVMLQRFYADQRTRSDGDSGIRQQRIRRQGTKNYHSESHNGFSIAAIHDHSDQLRTVGMGEVEVVLNGIQFRTKHNDYQMFMPDTESQDYHKTIPVEFPEVPENVTQLNDVKDQIAEMREYFRAFRDQNETHRNYKPYFKSVLCYMEGTWINASQSEKVEQPFEPGFSKWRYTNPRNWKDLFDRNNFAEATGGKERWERMPTLPYTLLQFNGTEPVFAQWHYRILCHPTKELLPTKRLRSMDDFAARMMVKRDTTKYNKQRQARFQINPEDDEDTDFNDKKTYSKPQFLDKLMEEIPGKNNYKGNMQDEGYETMALNSNGSPKNAAFYHRWFRIGGSADAMGVNDMKRGYSDNFMFAAMTDHEQVVPMTYKKCKNNNCKNLTQRWTFAIPLEIVYLTPLNKWDPYNIGYKGDGVNNPNATVTGWGSCKDSELDQIMTGANSLRFYRTPWEFYSGLFDSADVADQGARHVVCAYDQNKVRRKVAASGTWIILPEIVDVGRIRTRYPIMPINGEGSAEWKELTALKDIMMDESKSHLRWVDVEKQEKLTLVTGPSTPNDSGLTHSHKIYLTKHEVIQLKGGKYLTKKTTTDKFHSHEMFIRYRFPNFEYMKCDGESTCSDGHSRAFGQEKTTTK